MSTRGARFQTKTTGSEGGLVRGLEAKKHCLHTLQEQDEAKLMFIDVKKAHLNAKCDEEEGVELPDEFKKFPNCAKLMRWLYGMRKAASGWEDDHARRLVNDRVSIWQGSFKNHNHPKTHVRVVVHGDDFTFAATDSELMTMRSRICQWYDVKVRGFLCIGKRDVREIEMLQRSLRWTEEGSTKRVTNVARHCWEGWD